MIRRVVALVDRIAVNGGNNKKALSLTSLVRS